MRYSKLRLIVILLLGTYHAFSQNIPFKNRSLTSVEFEPGIDVEYCNNTRVNAKSMIINQTADYSTYDMKHLKMELDIDPAVVFLTGAVISTFEVRKDVNFIEMEFNTDYTIDSIVSNGNQLDYQHSEPWNLIIYFPVILETGDLQEIEIYYHGIPSSAQGFGSVGYGTHNDDPAMWTLSEPYGARDWWPGKNDLTDKIDSLDVIVNCPETYRAASNGILIADEVNNGIRINHWKHKYPIAPYLIAVGVTNYAVYTDTAYSNGEILPIINYVFPENLTEIQQQTQITTPLMELFSELFIQYPFINEKYGHAQFGWGGGMEHQTMSFMGRFDYDIIAHELAHQWFGDMVTLNSWHDIWLNEGFATYLTGLSYEHMSNDIYWPIWKKWNLESVVSLPSGSVFVEDTTDINRIFSSRLSYSKGALVLHSLRWLIGDEAFYQGCINYLNDSIARYAFASNDLFKGHMEATSGIDLTEFFEDWYYGEGYPTYNLSIVSIEDNHYTLQLSQTTSDPSVDFFEMPVPVSILGNELDTLIILENTNNNQQFIINPGFTITSMEIDPDQWLISANNSVILDTTKSTVFTEFKVYPNPAIDNIRIELGKRRGNVSIIDIAGREVISFEGTIEKSWINISHLKSGVYYIRINDDRSPADKAFVKL